MNEALSTIAYADTVGSPEPKATPFYFTSQGQSLFAWLHTPANGTLYDHGVVVCPSLGHEQVHAYRSLRHLAETLASRGIAVLRFDWFGTGDSAGGDNSPAQVASWMANVHDAVATMKHELGLSQISLIGFRLGGLLAVEGIARAKFAVDNLVLWAPVANGRAYVRELRLLDSTSSTEVATKSTSGGISALESGGFRFSPETVDGLSGLKLTQCEIACRHALVVHRNDTAGDCKIVPWLKSHDVEADACFLPGVREMLVEPHLTQVPHEAIEAITTWLADRIDATTEQHPFDLPMIGEGRRQSVKVDGIVETIWKPESTQNLTGVVCEPTDCDPRLPMIALLNSGAAYRIGVSRLNVLLARRLAKLGFRSLRFDFRGLGDSPVEPGHRENDTYPSSGFNDLSTVLDAAVGDFGHDRCVFLGLCSGAYFAFQAASQFRDRALVESILINPLTYYWREGMTIDDPELRAALESHWLFTRRIDARRIWKLLSGQSKIGYRGAAREIATKVWHALRNQAALLSQNADEQGVEAVIGYGHPKSKDLPQDLMQVAKRGRKLALFVADTDPGLAIMNAQAPRQAKQLIRQGVVDVKRFADADHTFSRSGPRNELINAIAEHLARRYL